MHKELVRKKEIPSRYTYMHKKYVQHKEGRMIMAPIEITEQNFEQEVLKSDIPVLVDFWAVPGLWRILSLWPNVLLPPPLMKDCRRHERFVSASRKCPGFML